MYMHKNSNAFTTHTYKQANTHLMFVITEVVNFGRSADSVFIHLLDAWEGTYSFV